MGDYRIAVWLWTHFDVFMNYVTLYADGFADNQANEKKSAAYLWMRALTDILMDQLRMELAWLLNTVEPLVTAITQLQSSSQPVVHRIAPLYRELMTTFDIEPANYDFLTECLHDDALLKSFYKERENSTKRAAKKTIVAAMLAGRAQLRKNFGVINRCVVWRPVEAPFIARAGPSHADRVKIEEEHAARASEEHVDQRWTLAPWKSVDAFENLNNYTIGDSSGKSSMLFYWIAELADIYAKDHYPLKPSRDMFYNCVPWYYSEDHWDILYDQLCTYIDARLVDLNLPEEKPEKGFDLILAWKALSRAPGYNVLALFFLRVLNVPGSSAQAERSISAYNTVVKDKRLGLSPERIPTYVMIYANGSLRQKRAAKRRKYASRKRRKEFFLDQETFSPEESAKKKART
jgi:hypothetical protein